MRYVRFKPIPYTNQGLQRIEAALGRDTTNVEKRFLRDYGNAGERIDYQYHHFSIYPTIEDVPDMIPLKKEIVTYAGGEKTTLTEIPKCFVGLEQVDEQLTINGLRMIE